ncbi:hypothetical protein SteCoe_14649 [Stentor coeruleus]|uniref:RING-type domain-containing protein n=1 Tax=Stentor coeruleus TaxID=5963 RepID=A0A1R2C5C9_9CILI|nr:hypothetical protein SteCoe_14649 [Stentor coeruleus]
MSKGFTIPTKSLPMKPLVKIPPERLLQNLKDIIQSLVPLVDINKFLLSKDPLSNELKKLVESGCEEAHSFLENLNSLCCAKCQNNNIKIRLSCGHLLCESCAKQLTIGRSIDCSNQSYPVCSICEKEMTESEFNTLFKNEDMQKFLEMENEHMKDMLNQNGILKCRLCNKDKSKYFDTSCYHLCMDCVANRIRSRIPTNNTCPICSCEYEDINELINKEIVCENCLNVGYFIGDYMRAIDGEKYFLCSTCLYYTQNQGICQKTNKRITKKEKLEISDFLFGACEGCGKEVYRGYMKLAKCCTGVAFCIDCANTPQVCKKCMVEIEYHN